MNLINLETVTVSLGIRAVLDEVSLGIAAGERIGVVGRNGAGKSTLLSAMTRDLPVDGGRVTHVNGLRVGVLTQSDNFASDMTVREAVVGDLEEHAWAGDSKVRDVLRGLGLGDSLERTMGPMSGGERRRVGLASLLVRELDLIVLDEPTNHLDIEGVTWLASHLNTKRQLAVLVVTHDRWFLDEVTTQTWEVIDGKVESYEGGYAAYVLAKAERMRQDASAEARRQNLMRKELAWLRRGPPARTSKPNFRIEAAQALIADEPPARDRLQLEKFSTTRLGKQVFDIEDASYSVGGRTLFDNVTWRLGPGDRVAIVGVNGSGKTTLLRLLSHAVQPQAGVVKNGKTVKVGYLDQHIAVLDPSWRALEAVEKVARITDLGGGRTVSATSLLERFGFTGQRQWTPVGDLSGGERRRLQILRLLMSEPNVLLLDEPTNDLDVETLNVIEDMLDGWAGTLIVVSHDRYFIERVTDRVVGLMGDGKIRDLPGGVEEYLRRRGDTPSAAVETQTRDKQGDTRLQRKELSRLEREISKLDDRVNKTNVKLSEIVDDFEEAGRLAAQIAELSAEREVLEEQWLELSEQLA